MLLENKLAPSTSSTKKINNFKLYICIGFIKVRVESSSLARHLVSRQFEFYQEDGDQAKENDCMDRRSCFPAV